MGDDSILFSQAVGWDSNLQDSFVSNNVIFLVKSRQRRKTLKNQAFTAIPPVRNGRYYVGSKPGGPLSQDTHTSSGLSICGLGVAS